MDNNYIPDGTLLAHETDFWRFFASASLSRRTGSVLCGTRSPRRDVIDRHRPTPHCSVGLLRFAPSRSICPSACHDAIPTASIVYFCIFYTVLERFFYM